jgi:Arc/MetJ family transcription regulator
MTGSRGVDYCTNWCYEGINTWELPVRSTINLDDNLMEQAKSLTGTKETAALVRQALETLVRVESGKRLIALGGTMPEAEVAPRRRSEVSK